MLTSINHRRCSKEPTMPRLLRLVGTAALPAALAIALLGVPAVAAVEPAPIPIPAPLTLDPVPGGLAAFGHGSARIRIPQDGSVTGKMTLGRLRVRGADAVIVEACASRETLKDGSILYRGVRGPFSLTGRTFTVSLAGDDLRFAATGDGIAVLRGHGKFRVDGRAVRGWTLRGIHVRF
jgi:hypothetical protein